MKKLFHVAAILVALVSCSEQIEMSSRYVFEGKTIAQYLEGKEYYSEYVRLLGKRPVSSYSETTLLQLLSARGHYTVFAPTNEAIQQYLDSLFRKGVITEPSWTGFPDERSLDSIEKVIVFNSILDGGDQYAFDVSDIPEHEHEFDLANMNNRKQRVLSKAAPFTVEQLREAEADVFHLGTLLQDDFSPEVVEYLAGKGRVCVDVQGYLREVRDNKVFAVDWCDKLRVLKSTDILKVNEHEIDVLTDGEKDLHRAARLIRSWGVREVLITLGSYGSVIYADDQFYEIPGYPPHLVVDATGCGDTYAAGYLYARSHGASYDEAGRLAAAMCTLKLEHTGPFDATIDDVRHILQR